MSMYHINPETGNPGVCSAKTKCPYGGDDVHYFSREAAQSAFEEATKDEALKAWKRKKVTPDAVAPAATPAAPANPSSGHGFHGRPAASGYGFHGAAVPVPVTPPPAPKPARTRTGLGGHGSAGMPGIYGGHGR